MIMYLIITPNTLSVVARHSVYHVIFSPVGGPSQHDGISHVNINKMASENGHTKSMRRLLGYFVCLNVLFVSVWGDDLSRCPPNLPRNGLLRTLGDMCYQFVRAEKHWPHARQWCHQKGGELITIPRREVQIMVERTLYEINWGKNGMWIGATDSHDEQNWKWVTGERVNQGFQNWDRGQPSCFLPKFLCGEDCACLRLDEGYKWHDYFCKSTGFEYGFACQYKLLPTTTTSTTTTTIKTTTTTKSVQTTPTTTPLPPTTTEDIVVVYGDTLSTSPVQKHSQGSPKPPSNIDSNQDSYNTSGTGPPGVVVQVERQRLSSSEEGGLKTGGVVGMVVSLVLVFIAGLVVGIFMCRRRRKQYVAEDVGIGFNNVLYTAAPSRPSARIKETNILAAAAGTSLSDDEDPDDHKYVDISEITPCSVKCVDLPTSKELEKLSYHEPRPHSHCYDTIPMEEEPEEEVDGAIGGDAPPPCAGVEIHKFAPEFLKKGTDVSQAYSNNLYGVQK